MEIYLIRSSHRHSMAAIRSNPVITAHRIERQSLQTKKGATLPVTPFLPFMTNCQNFGSPGGLVSDFDSASSDSSQ